VPWCKALFIDATKIELTLSNGDVLSYTKQQLLDRVAQEGNKTKALNAIKAEIVAAYPNIQFANLKLDFNAGDGAPLDLTWDN
jgi:hypothetical protein